MKFNNHNVYISPNTKIGQNVQIGDNVTIYDNVQIGDNSIICNDCIIGEPTESYYCNKNYINPDTKIGKNALIRSHTIIYADSEFGDNFSTGHRVTIREGIRMGSSCSVGTLSDLQGYSSFGDYCRLHSNVHIGQKSKVGNFVFIYPYVVFTNDPHPPSNICEGPTIGDFTQIAVHSIILPQISIGSNCLVGANTTVNKNVEDGKVVVGSPGKVVCNIREICSKENNGKNHYPWVYNFERGMPWEGVGYDIWLKEKQKSLK